MRLLTNKGDKMTKEEKQAKKDSGLEYVNNHASEVELRDSVKEQFNLLSNKKIGQLRFNKDGNSYVLVWSKPSGSMRIETAARELVVELNQVNISNALEYISNKL